MPSFEVTVWDLVVLASYVIGSRLFFGWWLAGRASEDSEGYFLAGRRMTWPLIGLSFYVSNMSGSSFVGLPSSGYVDGIAVYAYEWLPALILVFFAFFILPFYLGARVSTAPEYLERRFSRGVRLAFSVFLLLANVFIDAAAALYAGATVAKTLFPEISISLTVALTAGVAGLYIFVGGLGAVVVNDALQAAVILAGGSAIAILGYLELPSWSAIEAEAGAEALSLFQPASDPVLPWTGVVTGVLVIGLYFWCANQFVVQRALAARDLEEGRKGALFAGLLKLPNLFILILPGLFARVLYPELERPDLAFPVLAFDLLPIGLRGLMLAALAAAILSSLEAILNSASTLFTLDLAKTARPDLSEPEKVRLGRLSTLGFMVLAAVWAPRIADFPSLWRYLQSILSYVTPPVVAVFGLGLFSPRANARGALVVFGLMLPVGVTAWASIEILGLVEMQFLHASGLLFAASVAVGALASRLGPAPDRATVERLTWTVAYARREARSLGTLAWHRDPRVLAAGLLALTFAIVFWWR